MDQRPRISIELELVESMERILVASTRLSKKIVCAYSVAMTDMVFGFMFLAILGKFMQNHQTYFPMAEEPNLNNSVLGTSISQRTLLLTVATTSISLLIFGLILVISVLSKSLIFLSLWVVVNIFGVVCFGVIIFFASMFKESISIFYVLFGVFVVLIRSPQLFIVIQLTQAIYTFTKEKHTRKTLIAQLRQMRTQRLVASLTSNHQENNQNDLDREALWESNPLSAISLNIPIENHENEIPE